MASSTPQSLEPDLSGGEPIRVILADLPELLAQVITHAVTAEAGMLVVGHARNNFELLQLAAAGADVLVLGAPHVHPPPGICSHLLAEVPGLKILVVDPSGTEAMRYWVAVRRMRTTVTTRRRLVRSIRRLAQMEGLTGEGRGVGLETQYPIGAVYGDGA